MLRPSRLVAPAGCIAALLLVPQALALPLAARFAREVEAAALGAGRPPVRVALLPLSVSIGGAGLRPASRTPALAALAAALPDALGAALADRPLLARAPAELERRLARLEPAARAAAAREAGVDLVVAPRLWIGAPGWGAGPRAPVGPATGDARVVLLVGEAWLADRPGVPVRLSAAASAADALAEVAPAHPATPFALLRQGSLGPIGGPLLAAALAAPDGRLEGAWLAVLVPDALHLYRLEAAGEGLTRISSRALPPPAAAARGPRHPVGTLVLLPGAPTVALLRTADRTEALRLPIAADGSIGPAEGTGADLFPLCVVPETIGGAPGLLAAGLEPGTTRFAPRIVRLPGEGQRLEGGIGLAVGSPFVAAAAWDYDGRGRLAVVDPAGRLRILAVPTGAAAQPADLPAPAPPVAGVGDALAVLDSLPGGLLAASAASAPGEGDRVTLFAPGPAGPVPLWRSGPREGTIEALAAAPGGLLLALERSEDGEVAVLRLAAP